MNGVGNFALITLAVVYGVYSLFSSGLCGVALARVYPNFLVKKRQRKLENPAWELGSLFLLFGLGGFMLVFGNANSALGELDYWLVIALLATLMRASLLLWIGRQREAKKITTSIKWLFALCCFSAPLAMAAIGVYMLSGKQFWETANGGLLMLSALFGLTAVGLALVGAKKKYLRTSVAIWLLVFGCIWPLSLEMSGSLLAGYWLGLWLSTAVVVISLVVLTDGIAKRYYLRVATPVLALLSFPLLAGATLPSLVFAHSTVEEAFSATGSEAVVVGLCLSVLLVSIYALIGLARLSEPGLKLNQKL